MVADPNWPITRFGVDLNRTIPTSVVEVAGNRVHSTSYHHMLDADVRNVGLNGLESIEDLRALTEFVSSTMDLVYVKSYHAGRNKGGGVFVLDATDESTPDDGFLTIVDLDGNRWKRSLGPEGVDAYMAGARGDASIDAFGVISGTDDTAVINQVFSYVRTSIAANPTVGSAIVTAGIGDGVFRCDSPVNATTIGREGLSMWTIDCRGSTIASKAAGKPAVDFSNGRNGEILGLNIVGDSIAIPAVGLFLNRIGVTTDRWRVIRCSTNGYFLYAGFHNCGAEQLYMEHCDYQNLTDGPCYGLAQDSRTYLRYEPPVTPSSFSTADPMVVTTGTSHGLVTGSKVYIVETRGADLDLDGTGDLLPAINRKWVVTRISDTQFSVPVSGASYLTGGRYFKVKYDSDFISDDIDIITPWVGDGMFEQIIVGCHGRCVYGIAGWLETPKGRHYYTGATHGSIHDDFSTVDKTLTSVTVASRTAVCNNHGLTTGDVIWLNDTMFDAFGNKLPDNTKHYKVVVVDANTLTLTRMDGGVPNLDTTGPERNGTIRKQDASGGYGIHFLVGVRPGGEEDVDGGRYHIHHENGTGLGVHSPNAWGYLQNEIAIRDGTGPAQTNMTGFEMHEHAAHGVNGCLLADAGSISGIFTSGKVVVNRFSIIFGNGERVGKMFAVTSGSHSIWKVRSELLLAQSNVVHNDVDFHGDLITESNDENAGRRFGLATALTPDGSGVALIAHDLYKTPSYASVRILGDTAALAAKHVDVQAVGPTNISVRFSDAAGADVTTGTYNVLWEAIV